MSGLVSAVQSGRKGIRARSLQPAAVVPAQPGRSVLLQQAIESPQTASPADIATLQRMAGNSGVARLIQTKLMVGPAGDPLEREADQVADQVLNVSNANSPQAQRQMDEEEVQTARVQRQAEEEEVQTARVQRQAEEEEVQTARVQRQAEEEEVQTARVRRVGGDDGFEASDEFQSQLESSKSGGKSLPDHVRAEFEPRFGTDFSGVRVHTGAQSAQLNQSVQAQAFTHGNDIYFDAGKYDPDSTAGKHLLAHELTHTIQQGVSAPGSVARVQRLSKAQKQQNQNKIQGGLDVMKELRNAAWSKAETLANANIPNTILDQKAGFFEKGALAKHLGGVYMLEQKKNDAKAIYNDSLQADDKPKRLQVANQVKQFLLTNLPKIETQAKKLSSDAAARVILKMARHLMKSIHQDVITDERNLRATQTGWETQYATLENDLTPYAKRQGKSFSNVTTANDLPTLARVFAALPRGANNALTALAMQIIEQEVAQTEQTSGYFGTKQKIDSSTGGGIDVQLNLNTEINKLKTMLLDAANRHPLTHRTLYPELLNLKNPNTGQTLYEELPELSGVTATVAPTGLDQEVTQTVDVSGTNMDVTYNTSDVNYAERLTNLRSAVTKIKAAGFTNIPALDVHIPKFGRALAVTADNPPKEGSKVSRNEFVAPDHLHMSSAALGTPLTDVWDNPTTGQKEYKYSSTALDPTGIATLVHEFGHILHYVTSPTKYHGLHGASFATGQLVNTAMKVSGYATGNPREFVAETFMGAVYGRNFGNDIKQVYNAYGGPSLSALVAQGTGNMLLPV